MEEIGIDLQDVYDIQGRRKLMYLANNAHKEQTTGKLIRASHQAMIMETGIGGNIFNENYMEWKHCIEQKTWMSDIWKYCSETGIKIQPGGDISIRLRREADREIMGLFKEMGNKGKQLQQLNSSNSIDAECT